MCHIVALFLNSIHSWSYLQDLNKGERGHCSMRHGRSWVRAQNLHQCLQTRLQVCGSKKLGCHANLYTVSRCHTRGEFDEWPASKKSTLALKPRTDVTRSPKQEYQWPHKKDICHPKCLQKIMRTFFH